MKKKFNELEVISAQELMDMQFESTPMLIDQLIGTGVYLFAGAPKIGKSWLVLWLAHQVSRGEPVWEFQTRQADVVYLTLEDSITRILRRLVDISDGETGNILLTAKADLVGKGFEEQVVNIVEKNRNVRFVIIDTLQRVRQMDRKSYSYAGDYELISKLKEIADKMNICILLVHHTRKKHAEDLFSTISGTNGLLGSVDGALVLTKEKRLQNTATLSITGRDVPDSELLLEFDGTKKIWKQIGSSNDAAVQKEDALVGAVCRFIQEYGDFHGSATELLSLLSPNEELFIPSANSLTRKLNPNTSLLKEKYGIRYRNVRTSESRTIHLEQIPQEPADNDNTEVILPVA